MSCGMFEIKKFFCCWSLKVGSLIIGYLGLIGNLLQTAGGSAQLQYVKDLQYMQNFNYIVNGENATSSVYCGFRSMYTEWMSVVIAYHAVSFLFHVFLLWGIHKNRSEFILPWLVVKGFENVVVIIVCTVASIVYMSNPRMQVDILLLLIAVFMLLSCLAVYSYMCVYSYYHAIKAAPKSEEADFPPAYISSLFEEKKQNISENELNQNAV